MLPLEHPVRDLSFVLAYVGQAVWAERVPVSAVGGSA
jgi:hypothetical protein